VPTDASPVTKLHISPGNPLSTSTFDMILVTAIAHRGVDGAGFLISFSNLYNAYIVAFLP